MGAGRGKQRRTSAVSSAAPVTTSRDAEATIRRILWNYPMLYKSRTAVMEHLFTSFGSGYHWVGGQLATGYDDEQGVFPYEDGLLLKETERKFIAEREEGRRRDEKFRLEHPEEAAAKDAEIEASVDDFLARLAAKGGRKPTPRKPDTRTPEEKERDRLEGDEESLRDARVLWQEEIDRNKAVRDNLEEHARRTVVCESVYAMARPEKGQQFGGSPLAAIPDDAQEDWLDLAEEFAYVVLASTSSSYRENNPELDEERTKMNHKIATEALERVAELRGL